jgi:non-ribosomal peptide synthetase component F
LRKNGVGPETIVALMVERSPEMVIALIAILKAGGAYLPLDPGYPADRVKYILENSSSPIVVTKTPYIHGFPGHLSIIDLNHIEYDNSTYKEQEQKHAPGNLAYTMYTSGSTGEPKGVMIEHAPVINRINWMQKEYPLTEKDVLLLKTNYTFDVSVWELMWWSFHGASLYCLLPEQEKNPREIIKVIIRHKITVIHFVPSMFQIFLDYYSTCYTENPLTSLRYIFTSGEALLPGHVALFNKLFSTANTKLVNLYGPPKQRLLFLILIVRGIKILTLSPLESPSIILTSLLIIVITSCSQ